MVLTYISTVRRDITRPERGHFEQGSALHIRCLPGGLSADGSLQSATSRGCSVPSLRHTRRKRRPRRVRRCAPHDRQNPADWLGGREQPCRGMTGSDPEPRAGKALAIPRVRLGDRHRNLQARSYVSFFLVFVPTRYHVMLATRAMVQPKAAVMASTCKFSSAKMMSQTVRPFRSTISSRRSASNSQAISRDLRRSATVAAAGSGSLELVNAAAADSGTIPRVLTRPLVQFRDGR